MPSLFHEGLLEVLRRRPTLAVDLVRDVLHAAVPPFERARVGESNLTQLVPTEYRADLVLLLEDARADAPRAALVVEVQLRADPHKAWSWPAYLASLRARLRCSVALIVLTPDDAVARWAARPIETGHPGFALTPLVLGPGAVPVVIDEAEAIAHPELAVLSAMVHGRERQAIDIALAALAGARRLDDEHGALYHDLVVTSMSEAARAMFEALMASKYEFQSDFAKKYVAQGRAEGRTEGRTEGRAEGKAEGKAEALLAVLAARGIAVSEPLRQRVLSCSELALLDTWLARAVTAKTAAEVLGE